MTLTKCDTLVQPGDSWSEWMGRVEERKRELQAHFAEAFADDLDADSDTDDSFHRFGSLSPSHHATCVRVPPAFELYADGTGGLGVIDLAVACLSAARDQQDRVTRSRRQLRGTVLGVGGLLELIGGTLLVLGLFTRPVAFILSGMMAVAYFQMHWKFGAASPYPLVNMGELAVLYCWLFFYFVFAGPGEWALDNLTGRRRGAYR